MKKSKKLSYLKIQNIRQLLFNKESKGKHTSEKETDSDEINDNWKNIIIVGENVHVQEININQIPIKK